MIAHHARRKAYANPIPLGKQLTRVSNSHWNFWASKWPNFKKPQQESRPID